MAQKRLIGSFLKLLAVLLFFVVPLVGNLFPLLMDEWEARQFRQAWPVFADHYNLGKGHLTYGRYESALTHLDRAIEDVKGHVDFDVKILAETYGLKAEAHRMLWQFIDAESAFQKALDLAGDHQGQLRQRLAQLQDRIEKSEQERNDQSAYIAMPFAGPGKTLRGKVAVVYVFVDDGKVSQWNKKLQRLALAQFDDVKRWYQERALDYGISEPAFVDRIFIYDKDPLLRNALAKVTAQGYQEGYDLAGRVAQTMGHDTVNGFLEHIRKEEEADQAVMFLHVYKDARSFARRCGRGCWGKAEYGYVFKTHNRKDWDAMKYTQAHEGLHLFGADDLYNLSGARNYATRDIMHHVPRYLNLAVVDSITAYGIGWIDQVPSAPFEVKHLGGKND